MAAAARPPGRSPDVRLPAPGAPAARGELPLRSTASGVMRRRRVEGRSVLLGRVRVGRLLGTGGWGGVTISCSGGGEGAGLNRSD